MTDDPSRSGRRGFLALGGVAAAAVAAHAAQAGPEGGPPATGDAATPEAFGARRDDPHFDCAPAIEAAFATGLAVRFGPGTYHVGRSVGPGRRNASARFDDTTIRPTDDARIEDFNECLGWDGLSLAGRGGQANIPGFDRPVRALFDLTGARYGHYAGRLTLRGDPRLEGLAALAASNHLRLRAGQPGGGGSLWDCNLTIGGATYGMFGTPRLDAPSNEHYPDPFTGSVFGRVTIQGCRVPILAGANTLDNTHFGVLQLALGDGARGYLLATSLVAGAIYVRGDGDTATAVALDVQEATVSAGTLYAENALEVPVHLRTGAWIAATLRHGAGTRSRFARGAMVYCDAGEAGGHVTAHERCRDAEHMTALVRLRARAPDDARTFVVHQPYPDDAKPAFAYGDEPDAPAATRDSLVSHAPGGVTAWRLEGGRVLRYRHASGGPFAPVTAGADAQAAPAYPAYHGMAVAETGDSETATLSLRTGTVDGGGPALPYTDVRVEAARPQRLVLAAVEPSDLGRQVVLSARGAPVTVVADANARLRGGDVTLTRDGDERLALVASEYWSGREHRLGWVQINP